MNLPEKYTESMEMMLGDEYDSYIESFNDKRLYGLRVNNLKISTEDFLKICPFKLEPVPWIENGFYYSEDDKPAKHPYYFAGLYYIQEPSAMTPANVLPIEEGDVVFDMCAAPGGKSTELAAKLNKTGLLITNDISNSRAKALLKNVEVFGVPNLCVLNEDPVGIASRFSRFFDKVLIDAPCSGEGMFRKDNKLIKAWEKNGPEFYSQIQRNIILAGADMLKPGGKLLYSTCTFSKLEDEDSVIHLLTNRPDMHLIDIKPYEGFSHGFDTDEGYHLEKAVRIFPHKMPGEGHFVALFEKDGEDYTSSKLYELAKMDGAIILSGDLKKILFANAQLIPSRDIETRETGTRHRTAERTAKQTGELVISISQRRNIITIFKGNNRYILEDTDVVLNKANQGVQTLERYKKVFDSKLNILNEYEFNDIVTLENVIIAIQRAEMVMRIVDEIQSQIYELGSDGRLVKMQMDELIGGIEKEELLIIKDYLVKNKKKNTPEQILDEIANLPYEDLTKESSIARLLGFENFDNYDEVAVYTRGYRILSKVPRMPSNIVENLISSFKSFQHILVADIEDLDDVDGIGEVRARTIKQSLKRMQEQFVFDNALIV